MNSPPIILMYGSISSPWLWKVSVAQCMPTKPLPPRDGVEERLLAVLRHRLAVLVGARGGQVAGRLEGEGVPLADLVGVEEAAVLGGDDLEAVLLADLGQDPLGHG